MDFPNPSLQTIQPKENFTTYLLFSLQIYKTDKRFGLSAILEAQLNLLL